MFSLIIFFSKVMKKLSMEPLDRLTVLQTVWDNNKPVEPGPCGRNQQLYTNYWLYFGVLQFFFFFFCICLTVSLCAGGFSQMYRCVCDWLGLPYREEVQWVRYIPGLQWSYCRSVFSAFYCLHKSAYSFFFYTIK